ncbi:hypothetical protein GQ55_5G253800 [Panicum hallii var. hallii]|uniref:Secreted protein n=1 Tax=Panicum hallii var. hallii TaxID=1504633 RepID=A0A2T7DK23_9POAL|nr:hypothetical protein GQ55_5G253800 [Panicum hallii var. hallii]
MTWPVLLLHLTPLHWQQSLPLHEARRFCGSLVMPALNESSASLSFVMQCAYTEQEVVVATISRRRKDKAASMEGTGVVRLCCCFWFFCDTNASVCIRSYVVQRKVGACRRTSQ